MKPRMFAVSVAAGVALVAGGTAAYAVTSSPIDSSGVIHGCFGAANADGTSRSFVLQDAGTTCPANMTAIQWNQTGPAGPAGATGPQGPAGPSTAGPAGLDVIVVGSGMVTGIAEVQCPSGHPFILGGGGDDFSGGALRASEPSVVAGGIGLWTVAPVNLSDSVEALALCAK